MAYESQINPDYLTPDGRGNAGLLRSSASQHSFASKTTEVCDNPDYVLVERDANFTTLSFDVEFRVTRWEALKMLFFGSKRRTIPVEVQVTNMEEKAPMKRKQPSSYVFRVSVRSRRRDGDGRWIHEDASCTLDTGNQQGNFVSKDFVTRLGYTVEDFRGRELDDMEIEGRSATGHPLRPEGAIRLCWYRPGGPKIFDNMRFLVSAEVSGDLIIGEATIAEYDMLPPPMFAITPKTLYDYYNPDTDKARQDLISKVALYEGEIDTLEQNIKDCTAESTRKKGLQGQLAIKEGKLLKARKALAEDDETKRTQNKEGKSTHTLLPTAKESGTPKGKGGPAQAYTSDVMVTFAGGIKKQATGLTMRAFRK